MGYSHFQHKFQNGSSDAGAAKNTKTMDMRKIFLGAAFALSAMSATAQIAGSGTSGTVPQFTGTSSIGNSPIVVSGNTVGIGTATSRSQLTVNGDVVPGGNGVVRTIVPLAMNGGTALVNSVNWQRVTRTSYTSIPGLFSGVSVLPGATRQYFLIIRRADNASARSTGRSTSSNRWRGKRGFLV